MALFPYLLVRIVIFAIAKLIAPVKEWFQYTTDKIPWPGLSGEVLTIAGTPAPRRPARRCPRLKLAGHGLLVCSLSSPSSTASA